MSQMMNQQAAQNYLRTKVLTATPEQLQLMLFDGAIRFGEQAVVALQQNNWEQSFKLITSVQKIINELRCALKHDISPDLCKKLDALYAYAHRKSVEASIDHKIESMQESISILKYQRETWVLLMDQLSKQKAAIAAKRMEMPALDARMEASLYLQG